MSALLDSLAKQFDGDARQRALLDALLQDGLPQRAESWKYTSLRQLERRAFGAAQPVTIDATALAAIPTPRMVFINGQYAATLSDLAALDAGVRVQPLSQLLHAGDTRAQALLAGSLDDTPAHHDAPFAQLNAALAREGALVQVEAGVQAQAPLHLVNVGVAQDGDAAWHLRHVVALAAGARLCLVEHELAAGEHAHLGNVWLHAQLADAAQLTHARVQDAAPRAHVFARTDAVLADKAHYRRVDLELGAALTRNELNVRLQGDGAALHADGVLLADGRRHVETRLGIEHLARDTACALTWRGLAAQRGKAVFHGGITIHAGADGSAANLSNKNLLLSADAEIDTQPVLVIHADEVQATHGATVGQLDPIALFYLRSRGLPEADARRLLTGAFCREVVAAIGDATLRGQLETVLDAALGRVGA
jgi:Fe-S cluster assembly protein SufD